jgi:Arc/MetJ family transcription regulator
MAPERNAATGQPPRIERRPAYPKGGVASPCPRPCLHYEVYSGAMTRTNIDIDDRLIEQAMRVYRLRTKREAVELALKRLVAEPLNLDEALAMEGSGWGGDLEQVRRADRVEEL